ncbi:MAG: cysteine hydrolase [Campylobacterales bacterium]|nr:cysteine hydrolase [Campylobacterales bacterium]
MLDYNSCLLIVDVQNGFINEYTQHIPALVEVMQNDFKYVIVTKFYNSENSQYRKLLNWNKFSKNSHDTELAFNARKDSLILNKSIYTCINDEFRHFIRENSIKIIHICGIDTDICVTKCSVDIFEYGLTPIVLSNLCASHGGLEVHNCAIKILERFIGKNQIRNDY